MNEYPNKKIDRLRKSGQLREAWDFGLQACKSNPENIFIKNSFFWVCYEGLKKNLDFAKNRNKTQKNIQFNDAEIKNINILINEIIQLNLKNSNIVYVNLRRIFKKNMKQFPMLVKLLLNNFDSLFDDNDKIPFKNDKGESPSDMLQFTRDVVSCWLSYKNNLEISIDEICRLIQATKNQVRDVKNIIYLDKDEANCLISSNRLEEARKCALSVLKRKQTEPWAWETLATTYTEDNISIILLSKAITCSHDDSFVLPSLRKLAILLNKNGYSLEASMCINRAVKCYSDNGWKLKKDFEDIMNQSWYDRNVSTNKLNDFLQNMAKNALNYLHGECEKLITVVRNIHASGKGFHVYINKESSLSIRMGLCKFKKLPQVGDYILITIAIDEKIVIAAEQCECADIEDVSYKTGILKVHEKGFGFIDNTFVPKNIITPSMEGKELKILQIIAYDETKKRFGEKALKILDPFVKN